MTSGSIEAYGADGYYPAGIYNYSTGKVIVSGGTINAYYGIYTNSTGTVSVTGGTVTGSTTGIYSSSASTIEVTGGTVTGKSANGIYSSDSSATVTIGSSTATLSTTGSPKIVGGTYGVNRYSSTNTFDFGNGLIIGGTASYYGSATVTRENYKTKTDYNSTDSQYETYLVISPKPEDGATADSSVSMSTGYGTIDVIWLSGTSYSPTTIPNTPANNLSDMTKVTWTYDESTETWSEDDTAGSTWYNYTARLDKTDNNSSMWANAKNSDGSYFVWIPRYAYRITYYESQTAWKNGSDPTGYYDGYGMWSASTGKLKYKLDTGIKTVDYNGDKYIVHPAFMGTGSEDLGGGFGTETTDTGGGIKGFWVAKYEMSRTGASSSSSGSGTTFFSVPGVISTAYYNYTIGNMYTYSLNYDSGKESHLMKNSEWGAVAYLTHSQYGRNGYEIDINNSSDYITGNGGGAVGGSVDYASGTTNEYNTAIGAKASTTGNIYGIYDMSGGAYEYVAAWDTKSASSRISDYGDSFASKGGTSTKYATTYSNGTNTDFGTEKEYDVGKTGDATKEVKSQGISNKSHWFSDKSVLPNASGPYFVRGGGSMIGNTAGLFAAETDGLSGDSGSGDYSVSFRVVLCP